MKKLVFASLALISFAATASAGEPIANATLSSMGLGSMQSLSDNEGMTVRGKGTLAQVFGSSTAVWNGSSANNNYEAGAQWVNKPSLALGESRSFAGLFEAQYGSDPTGSALSISAIGGIAGGSAKARAF